MTFFSQSAPGFTPGESSLSSDDRVRVGQWDGPGPGYGFEGEEEDGLLRREEGDDAARGYTAEEEAEVVRTLDRKLVVFVALLYMFSFLDRSNIGNAKIAGMDQDLQTTPPRDDWYEWALSAFYITYILFEWMSLLWRVVPAHVYITLLVASWGVISSLQALVTSYPYLIALRALLGIGEAGFTGVPFYLSFFFKREEQAYRTAIFISAAPLASSFASSLAYLIVRLGESSPVAPWRLLFLLEGFPSVIAAAVAWNRIPDSPQTAHFLTPRQRKIARLRLIPSSSATATASSPSSSSAASAAADAATPRGGIQIADALRALASPVAWLTASMFFLTNMAYSSFPVFLPTIIRSIGHSPLASQALSFPPYLLAFATVLLTAHLSDRAASRSPFILFHALLSCLGYSLLALSEPLSLPPTLRYLALFPACAGFFSVVCLTVTWSINNQPTPSSQGSSFALLQLVGQCGPLLGTRLYPASDAPYFASGMGACAVAMLGVAGICLVLRVYMTRWNERVGSDVRRPLMGGGVAESEVHEEEGKRSVDRFRYMV
ncbi:related to nicotinamide mononucleotide permease [Cephalotrichum gorgonifer]|uniref:Related to nicotinamide mononucleotide permease n=1 Tax=Cephalotrichum gorgonifer TaxID=2041049 RepID=A0AAE8MT18_9PEZI|nr:related to nicotinamide mononucleotide permease [Cephalotrichum gorgonifer]